MKTPPLSGEPTDEREAPVWRCFHCNELFTTVVDAAFHFGYADLEKPACLVDVVELRNLQLALRKYREEDTDLHRQIARMETDHQQALMREEEKGYARGLADARKHPEDIAPLSHPDAGEPAQPPASPLDDPHLQELFGAAITGAMALGFQDSSPPPEGHWLVQHWTTGRETALAQTGPRRTWRDEVIADEAMAEAQPHRNRRGRG